MDVFQDKTKSVPKSDGQIIRVDMETLDIGGRKSHLPKQDRSSVLPISHVKSQS